MSVEGRGGPAFWRVFPWNPTAADCAPFSPRYVPPPGRMPGGRFNFDRTPVLYLAETPEHALSEILRHSIGKPLLEKHLLVHDGSAPGTFHRYAVVRATPPERVLRALPDLGDGATLHRLGIRADHLASESREVTREIARRVHARGFPGFRWWSALHGDWHVTVLFLDRVDPKSIDYGTPEPLSVAHPVVRAVANRLHMPLPPSR